MFMLRWLHEEKVGRPLFPKALGKVHQLVGLTRLVVFFFRACLGVVDYGWWDWNIQCGIDILQRQAIGNVQGG
jgi:hypothetical protein